MTPNFLVIGAPRSGTTWLYRNLKQHPDIFMPAKKELHFFDRHYDEGIPYYEALFDAYRGETAIGEATPAYMTKSDIIAPRIHQYVPDVKLIACLRNPIDRVYSRYWNAKAKVPENAHLSFEEKIAQKPMFIEEGFYIDLLRPYFELFPQSQIFVGLFDQLQEDPVALLQGIYRFLGVDDTFVPATYDIQVNAAASKQRLGKSKVIWKLHQLLVRFEAYQWATRLEYFNRTQLPSMAVATRRRLVEIYAPKNEALAAFIGRDLSHWNKV